MAERRRFIEDWLAGGRRNVAALSRAYGISRKTGHGWVRRYLEGGWAGLADRSHARRDGAGRIAADIERRLVATRREHPTWGPKKLRAWLMEREPNTAWPAESTIGEALRRAGLTRPQARSRRLAAPSDPSRGASEPNAVWTIDYKGQFRTGDGRWLYPLTVMDAHSRYLLACVGHGQVSGPAARTSLTAAFREYGLPERIRSDNGSPFASAGAGRISRLSAWWLRLGIGLERIDPGRPQQNGRHERMHRVLKAETARPPAENHRRQQERFDRFRDEYNQERPHEALGQRPPATVYVRSGRAYPARLPDPEYPGHWERRRVRRDGRMKFQGHQRYLSEALAGEVVGLVEVEEERWQVWFCNFAVAVLDMAQGKLWAVGATGRRPAPLQAVPEEGQA